MLTIDGTDGGGQMLRTALSLAAVTDTPFRIEDIRGARPTPGIRPQHLAAIELVASCCDAELSGAEIGSDSLTFEPGEERQTALSVDVQTAGSVTLLFDTVLPIATIWDEAFRVEATGGTDVKWSPTMDYHRLVKLPLLARFGLDASVSVDQRGFYPAGGGAATLETSPSLLSPIRLDSRGPLETVEIHSVASESLEDQAVADRQASHAEDLLQTGDLPTAVESVEYVPAQSPGSALLIRGVYAETLLGADALGERGRSSEKVAELAVDRFETERESGAPVDVHMADQLLVFLALVGGEVKLPSVTNHVRTNLRVLQASGSDVELDETGTPTVSASPHPALSR